jgi:hypothetical protein
MHGKASLAALLIAELKLEALLNYTGPAKMSVS